MNRRHIAADDRAATTPVSNVLTIGITTIMILGLLLGATGLMSGQQEESARSELRAVGESLALELERVAALARTGGSPNVTSQHASRVVGGRYTVKLLTGSLCDTYRTPSDTCLRLTAQGPGVTQYVPVENDSSVNIYLEANGQGEFALSARPDGTSTGRPAGLSDTDPSFRIGVGRNTDPRGPLFDESVGSAPPAARFTYSPSSPQDGAEVEFDASNSSAPDGSIEEYQWDFDDDGSYETTTRSPTYTRTLSGGRHNVSLRVVDDSGIKSTRTRVVEVSWLVLDSPVSIERGGGPETAVSFEIRNNLDETWESQLGNTVNLVTISSITVDFDNPDIENLNKVKIDGNTLASGSGDDNRVLPPIYDNGSVIRPDVGADGEVPYDDPEEVNLVFDNRELASGGIPNNRVQIKITYVDNANGRLGTLEFTGCTSPPGDPDKNTCD